MNENRWARFQKWQKTSTLVAAIKITIMFVCLMAVMVATFYVILFVLQVKDIQGSRSCLDKIGGLVSMKGYFAQQVVNDAGDTFTVRCYGEGDPSCVVIPGKVGD